MSARETNDGVIVIASTKHGRDFTKGKIIPQILKFVVPIYFSSVLQLLYSTADKIIVGRFATQNGVHIGKQALAAVGSTTAVTELLINLFIGLTTGATIICAKAIGSDDKEKVGKILHTSVIMGLGFGTVLGISSLFFVRPLLTAMNTPETVLDMAVQYMTIYFLGAPFSLTYNFGAGILRSAGETRRPLIILVISGILNVILNLLFVVVIPLGIVGVAIGTFASQVFSCIGIIYTFMQEDGMLKFSRKNLRISKSVFFEILKVGLPLGFANIMYDISNVIFQINLNSFGEAYLSGAAIAEDIVAYCFYVLMAFRVAVISFVGQNVGAGNYKRVSRGTLVCYSLCNAVLLVLIAVILPNRELMLHIYTGDAEVIAAGVTKLTVFMLSYLLFIPNMVLQGAVNGIGKTTITAASDLAFICLSRIVWFYTGFKLVPTFTGLLMCYPISWGLASLSCTVIYIVTIRKQKAKTAKISN